MEGKPGTGSENGYKSLEFNKVSSKVGIHVGRGCAVERRHSRGIRQKCTVGIAILESESLFRGIFEALKAFGSMKT